MEWTGEHLQAIYNKSLLSVTQRDGELQHRKCHGESQSLALQAQLNQLQDGRDQCKLQENRHTDNFLH